MAAKRMKKEVFTGVTGEAMEQAFSDYAIADAKIAKYNADMDVAITKIREKYADDMAKYSDMRAKAFDTLQAYAMENREEMFSKRKSLEMVHGTFGFRTGTPSIKQMKGFTVASSLNLALTYAPDYVRTKQELDKASLIINRDQLVEVLPQIGVYIDQTETFFVEPKKEEALV
jgi:phage host-nuclease inhibitor protein Gam